MEGGERGKSFRLAISITGSVFIIFCSLFKENEGFDDCVCGKTGVVRNIFQSASEKVSAILCYGAGTGLEIFCFSLAEGCALINFLTISTSSCIDQF
jgi:hypothetical protein